MDQRKIYVFWTCRTPGTSSDTQNKSELWKREAKRRWGFGASTPASRGAFLKAPPASRCIQTEFEPKNMIWELETKNEFRRSRPKPNWIHRSLLWSPFKGAPIFLSYGHQGHLWATKPVQWICLIHSKCSSCNSRQILHLLFDPYIYIYIYTL